MAAWQFILCARTNIDVKSLIRGGRAGDHGILRYPGTAASSIVFQEGRDRPYEGATPN